MLVEKTRTPIAKHQLEVLIELVLCEFMNSHGFINELNPQAVSIVKAHLIAETGRNVNFDCVYCHNNNFGNIRCFDDSLDFVNLNDAWEIDKDGKRYTPKDQRFRAFNDHEDGLRHYMELIFTKYIHASLVLTSDNPTPMPYVLHLKKGGYFTANYENYLSLVTNLYNEFERDRLKK